MPSHARTNGKSGGGRKGASTDAPSTTSTTSTTSTAADDALAYRQELRQRVSSRAAAASAAAGTNASAKAGGFGLLKKLPSASAATSPPGMGAHPLPSPLTRVHANKQPSLIQDVWAGTFAEAIQKIEAVIEDYPFVAVDTEFPGVVARPTRLFDSGFAYHFATLVQNVNLLKIIQLGLTFYNEKGERPTSGTCTWQFNFKYSLGHEMYAPDSIQLLLSAGLDFAKHARDGIDPEQFAAAFMMSGALLNDDVHWVCFHGGYDFGYLLKTITCQELPETKADFFYLLRSYFPNVYDLKFMTRAIPQLRGGGLQHLANLLHVERTGVTHQAGSDSIVTGDAFFKLRDHYLNGKVDASFRGNIYGLGGLDTFSQWGGA